MIGVISKSLAPNDKLNYVSISSVDIKNTRKANKQLKSLKCKHTVLSSVKPQKKIGVICKSKLENKNSLGEHGRQASLKSLLNEVTGLMKNQITKRKASEHVVLSSHRTKKENKRKNAEIIHINLKSELSSIRK